MNNRPMIVAVLLLAGLVLSLAAAPHARAQVGKNMGLLNPNTAGAEEFAGLPGLNPDLAGRIVAGRPYLNMEALDKALASALSADQRKELYARLFLPINLNNASVEAIRMVPGVGRRMSWEFREYRPYRALAEFQREIGKYVDDAEVARLEQYVFVPIKLNSASDAHLRTIPGLGEEVLKMIRDSRPFTGMEDFRGRMSAHAGKGEVARLARYLTIE
ncbi:MAG: helix-hairpin-helix domain-containing protein [Deltaproteobacteria bacterium]|nr:helix-hairpin-helix domain-containing protein [Deltaproteobacteria bacterium]